MTDELYKRHRPGTFKQVVGQEDAIAALMDMGKRKAIPHAILFTGPSGCGKTTLARILRTKLKCNDADFKELNCADFRGIDMVRDIRKTMNLAPMASPCRVYLIDEVHQFTAPAQDAFLKLLEDTPGHVYFMLATTDPQKLKKTVRTRCTDIKVALLSQAQLRGMVERVIEDEEAKELDEEVMDALVAAAEGSARKALVILHQIIGIEDEEKQLGLIAAVDEKKEGIAIARALLDNRTKWADMAAILRDVEEDPESLRYMVLGYASKVLLGRANRRAATMIQAFRDNFYDSKKAGLILACYEVIEGGE